MIDSLINDDDDDHSEGERKEQKRLPPVGHPDPVQVSFFFVLKRGR